MQVCACMQEEDPASTRADEPSETKTAMWTERQQR